jgi:hypothetical protein
LTEAHTTKHPVQAAKMKTKHEHLLVALHERAQRVGGQLAHSLSPQEMKMVGALIRSGGLATKVVETAFAHCRLGKYREVENALGQGVPVQARCGKDNDTMLHVCASNGQKRIAKLLLRKNANINARNDKGDTPLHCCHRFNYHELGDYLRSKGASDSK